MTRSNKVKFNLKNVHYSKVTETDGAITYGTPVAWPGAVSLSLDAQGDTSTFYADGIAYYVATANNGYSGDFESALIPEAFRTDILGEVTDSNGVLTEKADATQGAFALLFQFDGDANATKHVLYNCKCTRPSISSATSETSKDPQTETITITASPRDTDGVIKADCSTTTAAAYGTWFTTVYEPKYTA